MAKLTISRPEPQAGIYWPNKQTEKFYINDAKTDLGLIITPGWGITIKFLLPDKKTMSYGELALSPQQAEALMGMLENALIQFQPDMVFRNGENEAGQEAKQKEWPVGQNIREAIQILRKDDKEGQHFSGPGDL